MKAKKQAFRVDLKALREKLIELKNRGYVGELAAWHIAVSAELTPKIGLKRVTRILSPSLPSDVNELRELCYQMTLIQVGETPQQELSQLLRM